MNLQELKRELEDEINFVKAHSEGIFDAGLIKGLERSLELISEFEATIRKQLEAYEKSEKFATFLKDVKISGSAFQSEVIEELRKILGEKLGGGDK
jgi:hypothetical protein